KASLTAPCGGKSRRALRFLKFRCKSLPLPALIRLSLSRLSTLTVQGAVNDGASIVFPPHAFSCHLCLRFSADSSNAFVAEDYYDPHKRGNNTGIRRLS